MTKPLSSYHHPIYGDWLLDVQRPARYVGGEFGMVTKSDAPIRMALAFPDLYEIGMSHLGLRILYQVINSQSDMAAERVFMPWPDMEEQLRTRRLTLASLENARPLHEFPVVGFSLQYELTYTNLLAMLDMGGIPLRSDDRTERHPIILAGGPVATHAEPIAPFVDLFVIGEAEATITELLRTEFDARQRGMSRAERIAILDALPYCYAPALHPVVEDPVSGRMVLETDQPVAKRAWVEDLSAWPSPAGGPVPAMEAVFDRISLEIMRGCTQGCRFCQAGVLYRPVRELNAQQVADAIERAIRETGWDEASLTGLSPADHSHLLDVFHLAAQKASAQDVSLTVSSLRAYGLSEHFLDDLRTGRGGGLTFAPEAGTQRMRDLVNKNVSAEDLLATAREVSRRGWNRIKLYFMLGLPTETDEDLRAIVDLGWDVRKAARSAAPRKPPRVTCSLSTFVPKPHTPFQWEPMVFLHEIRRKQDLVRKAAKGTPVLLRFHEPKTSIIEGILCRGDRKLAAVVERAYRSGCRFDSWEEHLRWDLWVEALEAESIDMDDYLAGLPEEGRLPWDHIDVGLRPGFLIRERRKAIKSRPTAPCGQPDPARPDRIVCHGCGAPCDLDAIARRYGIQKTPGMDRPRAPRESRDSAIHDLAQTQSLPAPEGTVRDIPADGNPSNPTSRSTQSNPSKQEDRVRIRLRYSKAGPAVLWGHLSLVRHLPRTLRRAGLRIAYSEGFHPKPKIAYGPPLPVGWTGTNELCDILILPSPILDASLGCNGSFPDQTALQKLVEDISQVAPPGIEILDLRLLDSQEPALGRVLAAETYEVILPDVTRERVARGIEHFQANEDLFLTKTSKSGKQRKISLKKNLKTLDILHQEGKQVGVTMTLATGQGLSPLTVCDLLFEAKAAIVVRRGFLTKTGTDPFVPAISDAPPKESSGL